MKHLLTSPFHCCIHPNGWYSNPQAREHILSEAFAEARADVLKLWRLALTRARALAVARENHVRMKRPNIQVKVTNTQEV